MGDQNRRTLRRIGALEQARDRTAKRLDRAEQLYNELATKLTAVAEAAGSALAVEALCEIAGRREVGETMGKLMKRKQAEAEKQMATRVAGLVAAGQLVPVDVVGERSLVVGQRTEPSPQPDAERLSYRVDLTTPAMPEQERALYLGKKVGETVEQGKAVTTILEIYGEGDGKPVAQPAEAPGTQAGTGGQSPGLSPEEQAGEREVAADVAPEAR